MGFVHQHDTRFQTADKSVQLGIGQTAPATATPAPDSGSK
jgi:hypothetical protein